MLKRNSHLSHGGKAAAGVPTWSGPQGGDAALSQWAGCRKIKSLIQKAGGCLEGDSQRGCHHLPSSRCCSLECKWEIQRVPGQAGSGGHSVLLSIPWPRGSRGWSRAQAQGWLCLLLHQAQCGCCKSASRDCGCSGCWV